MNMQRISQVSAVAAGDQINNWKILSFVLCSKTGREIKSMCKAKCNCGAVYVKRTNDVIHSKTARCAICSGYGMVSPYQIKEDDLLYVDHKSGMACVYKDNKLVPVRMTPTEQAKRYRYKRRKNIKRKEMTQKQMSFLDNSGEIKKFAMQEPIKLNEPYRAPEPNSDTGSELPLKRFESEVLPEFDCMVVALVAGRPFLGFYCSHQKTFIIEGKQIKPDYWTFDPRMDLSKTTVSLAKK